MSLADLADNRRRTPKLHQLQTVFLCEIMQLAAFLCFICGRQVVHAVGRLSATSALSARDTAVHSNKSNYINLRETMQFTLIQETLRDTSNQLERTFIRRLRAEVNLLRRGFMLRPVARILADWTIRLVEVLITASIPHGVRRILQRNSSRLSYLIPTALDAVPVRHFLQRILILLSVQPEHVITLVSEVTTTEDVVDGELRLVIKLAGMVHHEYRHFILMGELHDLHQ